MGRLNRDYQIDGDVTPLVKEMTQEAINFFEGSSGESGPSQFTDETTAREVLGTEGTVASGRMSLTFAIEMLRRYFGADVFNRSGMVDLRFLRPVRPGDTLTTLIRVCEKRASQSRSDRGYVRCEFETTNQNGEVVMTQSCQEIISTRPK